jgi:cytochrome c553
MNARVLVLAVVLALLAGPGAGQGKRPAAAAKAPSADGNARAGEQIAAKGVPNGVTACISCHGVHGEGNAAAGFPRIAGQPGSYLNRQMAAFADGLRENPIMSPIAKAMTPQQMRDTSAWYASLQAPQEAGAPPAGAAPDAAAVERGRVLATIGDEAKQLQSCANCHGPAGRGEAPAYPYLAGQHAAYLTAAMAEWKSGTRKTDASGQMPSIAQRLDERDIAGLGVWFAAQPAPPAAGLAINIPAGSSAKPAVAAARGSGGPKAPSAPVAATGTEQGAPLTGGSQGPGGGGGTKGTEPPRRSPPPKR